MEQSRRAVESYWRSRMIDGVTSDEDKVAPVYKLEEVCELLSSSPAGIVKEVSEFVLKRLEHKSPIVKQKALRLIRYCVGKSGVEFRREMQKHSIAVRQLLHYKGQLDPLKGDAPNKAVRESAQEAMSAIFATEEHKPSPSEHLSRRIQGFGSTNYEPPSEDKKSFLSEVVDLGTATIKHGLSSFTQGNAIMKTETGSYKSPTLRRSLTTERDFNDRYEHMEYHNEPQGHFEVSKNQYSGPLNQDSRVSKIESSNGNFNTINTESKTREERLLETIVTSGGMRLQPTRDAIQVFLSEATKLDAVALSHALELKLQSPMWQVRIKAVCVLEAILRRKDCDKFFIVFSYFSENKDALMKCAGSPQASLREKTNKVLGLLGDEQTSSTLSSSANSEKAEIITASNIPDLIDTSGIKGYNGIDDAVNNESDKEIKNVTAAASLIDDVFGDENKGDVANDDDPFADVSFHMTEKKDKVDAMFSGLNVDNQQDANASHMTVQKSSSELFDIFGSQPELPKAQGNGKEDITDLFSGLSISGNASTMKQKVESSSVHPNTLHADSTEHPVGQVSSNPLGSFFSSQTDGANASSVFQTGSLPYNMPPGIMFNPSYPALPLNYGDMGSLLAQQQLLATMANFQLGNVNMLNHAMPHPTGTNGGYTSAIPDIFQSNFPNQTPTSMMTNSTKGETKAFDFISDHLSAARDPKRLA